MLANELRDAGIKVNTADPGYTATDINNNSGPQTIEEGSEAIVALATAGPDGKTGAYVDRHGTLPW
jgi:NAD(P)-dependent dehydrogenase (short-subunit alcohol dehydrogenase family)